MATLGIVSASFSIFTAIGKATLTISHFVREFRESEEDLDAVSNELQALGNVLHPLAQSLSSPNANLPDGFVAQVESTMKGCNHVIEQIKETVEKYSQEYAWTKAKWVAFGKSDVLKLRDSLEAYKMALSIGLHALSLTITQKIKDDTSVIRVQVQELRIDTNEILKRVDAIRQMGGPNNSGDNRIMEWMENMTLLSTYAESTYKPTEVDAVEFLKDQQSPVLSPVKTEQEQPELPTPLEDDTVETEQKQYSLPTPPADYSSPPPLSVTTDSTQCVDSEEMETPTTYVQELGIPSRSNSLQRGSLGQKTSPVWDSKPRATSKKATISSPRAKNEEIGPPKSTVHEPCTTCTCSRMSFKGIEDFEHLVRKIAVLVCRDEELIQRSIAQRKLMDAARIKQLDLELSKIHANTTAEWVRSMVAQGAIPNYNWVETKASDSVRAALDSENNECLYALLQCGADPNCEIEYSKEYKPSIRAKIYNRHTALSHATWLANETAAWALVAAGAAVHVRKNRHTCRVTFVGGDRDLCSSPLLRAICPKDPLSSSYSLRMTRFLLANGADPNHYGCDMLTGIHLKHRINTPFSSAILRHSDSPIFMSLVEALIAGGLDTERGLSSYSHYLSDDTGPDIDAAMKIDENPYHAAAYYGHSKILSLIVENARPVRKELRARAICIAAKRDNWDCVEILAKPPYYSGDTLHYVVMDYMRSQFMTWPQFSRTARLLVAGEAGLTNRMTVSYIKKGNFLFTFDVKEEVSVIELAETIVTKVSRRQVLKLLNETIIR